MPILGTPPYAKYCEMTTIVFCIILHSATSNILQNDDTFYFWNEGGWQRHSIDKELPYYDTLHTPTYISHETLRTALADAVLPPTQSG